MSASHLPDQENLEFPAIHESANGKLKIVAGPLLRYWGTDKDIWRGSVVYVTEDKSSDYNDFPKLELQQLEVEGQKIYGDMGYSFWRFEFACQMQDVQSKYSYQLGQEHQPFSFFIPAKHEDMNILFHSCNGFSLSTPTEKFEGSLWEDVLRRQEEKPFHVMLGGGDQLYCDSITESLPLFKKWTKKNTTHKGFRYTPNQTDKEGIEAYYLKAYIQWFGRGYWKGVNGDTLQKKWPLALAQVPMINIYDDHDIIDGFGSYKDATMKTPMFLCVAQAAHRYYLLFQLGLAPKNDPLANDPSIVTTGRNGPFMEYPARSLYARLGKSISFFGLDCRTERKAYQVVRDDSYDAMFNRLEKEFSENKEIKHLLLMLGVPIAYPRMVWAEALMQSWILRPVKWLARHKVILKGFVNEFDGQVELLDDLSDHWCAAPHKKERNKFLFRLQELAKKSSVRITILAGDVHLAGVGRFKTKDSKLSVVNDWRFMICPISSAITNAPPPGLLADFMNKRNHDHYLGDSTVEDMVNIFSVDTDGQDRNNNCTMPRRNFCILNTTPEGPPSIPGPDFNPKRKDVEYPDPAGSLKMTLAVEKNNEEQSGSTVDYSMIIPTLNVNA